MKNGKKEDKKREKFEEDVEKNYEIWFEPGWILGQHDGEAHAECKYCRPEDAEPFRGLESGTGSPRHDGIFLYT